MKRLIGAGITLGLGLGGFFDGIVLHQILGWHHLICVTEHCQPQSIEHLQRQNTQDGYFHLAVWGLTVLGIALLFRAGRNRAEPWPTGLFAGTLLAGWGAFNFCEGLIDHQILGIHHVRPGHPQQLAFDLLFLASGVVMMGVGYALIRKHSTSPRRP